MWRGQPFITDRNSHTCQLILAIWCGPKFIYWLLWAYAFNFAQWIIWYCKDVCCYNLSSVCCPMWWHKHWKLVWSWSAASRWCNYTTTFYHTLQAVMGHVTIDYIVPSQTFLTVKWWTTEWLADSILLPDKLFVVCVMLHREKRKYTSFSNVIFCFCSL